MSQLLLEGQVDDRDTIIAGLRQQLREAREELAHERRKNGASEAGVAKLRKVLTPLYTALQHIFGEIDGMGVEEQGDQPVPVGKSAVWESWKSKLPSGEARAIDALLLHGSLTVAQLRIHVGCASRTAQNIAVSLKGKGLVTRENGKITLKEI